MLCSNNCGFYSNANTEGLCSMCYKDMQKKMQESSTPAEKSPVHVVSSASVSKPIPENENADTKPSSNSVIEDIVSNIAINISSEKFESTPNILVNTEDKSSDKLSTPNTKTTVEEGNSDCLSPLSQSSLSSSEGSDGKKPKRRCQECKKKIGLTGFTCRCGGMFCSIHRYSDKHNCNHDYKSPGAEQIRKSNPTIVAEKVKKI